MNFGPKEETRKAALERNDPAAILKDFYAEGVLSVKSFEVLGDGGFRFHLVFDIDRNEPPDDLGNHVNNVQMVQAVEECQYLALLVSNRDRGYLARFGTVREGKKDWPRFLLDDLIETNHHIDYKNMIKPGERCFIDMKLGDPFMKGKIEDDKDIWFFQTDFSIPPEDSWNGEKPFIQGYSRAALRGSDIRSNFELQATGL